MQCRAQFLRTALPGVAILLVGLLVATGCSSGGSVRSTYSATEDVTEYRTTRISLPGTEWGGGYGSTHSLELWAQAQCRGQDCAPDRVTLIFQVSGRGAMRMQNQAVELKTAGATVASTEPHERVVNAVEELPSAMGVVAVLEMPFEKFRTIAEADELSGMVGTSRFQLRHKKRAPFRALVQRVSAPATETSEEEA